MKHNEKCKTCHLPVPINEDPLKIPCSEYHIRCVRCLWPVAKNGPNGRSLIVESGVCELCMGKKS
jgi:hypothetical protein